MENLGGNVTAEEIRVNVALVLSEQEGDGHIGGR